MIVTRGQTVVMWRVHMNVHAKRDSVVMDISVVEVGNRFEWSRLLSIGGLGNTRLYGSTSIIAVATHLFDNSKTNAKKILS